MKILVTGSTGQLGQELRRLAMQYDDYQFVFTNTDKLDLRDMPHVSDFIRYEGFDWIINAAAYTAVDKAEEDRENAFLVNSRAVFNMVQAAEWIGAKFIHISTDYVFDGKKAQPYTEQDTVNPLGIYAKSKAEGEQYVLKYNFGIVLRSSWLYSEYGNNFVKTMLTLAEKKQEISVVYDQVGTPTYALDLARMIMMIIEKHENEQLLIQPGLYHFSDEGVASWYDFAQAIFEYTGKEIKLFPIRTSQFPRPAPRPSFSVLDKAKIKSLYKVDIPHWRDSLKKALARLV